MVDIPDKPTVDLVVNGQAFGGWTKIEIFRSIEALCGSFQLDCSERWDNRQPAHSVKPGSPCRVRIDGDTVITGHIDETRPRYDKASHVVSPSGRDRTGDLVDCSAIVPGFGWTSANLMRIAQDLCAPFKIGVSSTVDVTRPYSYFRIQAGETVFEALERLARIYAVIITSDGRGNVVFTRAGSNGSNAGLKLGVNIERADGRFSERGRYSRYVVISQFAGAVILDPESAARSKGEAFDPAVGRYRPLLILDPNGDGDGVYLQQRALWEAAHRAGRDRSIKYTVPGWRDTNGKRFDVNRMIPIDDPEMGIKDQLLIVSTRFILDAQGTRCELGVTRRSAFELAPLSPRELLHFDAAPGGPSGSQLGGA